MTTETTKAMKTMMQVKSTKTTENIINVKTTKNINTKTTKQQDGSTQLAINFQTESSGGILEHLCDLFCLGIYESLIKRLEY